MSSQTPEVSERSASPGEGGSTSPLALLARHPLSAYYLLMGSALLLLLLGLIMVMSASSIESVRVFGSPYTLAQRQAFFALLGVVAMFFAARTSVQFWRAFAWPLLLTAFGFLVAVLIIGVEVAGQRNWIEIFGPFRFQPSEIAKLALVVWGAEVLSRRSRRLDTWRGLLIPIVPVAAVMMVLVLAEGDFGNTVMLGAILAGILFAAGAPLRVFAVFAAVGAVGVWILSLAAPYRMDRILSWLDPGSDRLGFGWQVTQGQYALGTGGFWGVGLGASREKWGTLPEAHTDFIYPVIGEELGLLGTLIVLALFSLLAFAVFRLSRNTDDSFVRYAAAGVGAWIVVQAVVNIGGVLGLLPVAGVTLPLVSYGGSSLIPTLTAIGMLMAFARQEPGARRALRRRSTAQALRRR
ncbi:MAG: putative lipid II flippase FtsW [Actinomycetales bacterium]|nr:putative lipid II flippase FtsW [Actinomycetales bacterium]MCP4895158.1 putative lipid II flippase FtsW [Actinomycetales bacterium]